MMEVNYSSQAAKIDEQREKRIQDWRRAFYAVVVLCALLAYNNSELRKVQRMWLPPDLSKGQSVAIGEPQKSYVHGFALTILSAIARWKEDGEKEYKENIYKFGTYISPKFVRQLTEDYESRISTRGGRPNELRQRTREISLINYDSPASMVRQVSSGRWHVYLDVMDEERLSGVVVKSGAYRYVLEVAIDSSDIMENDTGLRIMGLVEPPTQI